MAKMPRKSLRKNKRKVRKVRISKPVGGDIISRNNYSTVTETREFQTLVPENVSSNYVINLMNFPRALAMSKFFRFYRPKIAVFKYEPLFTEYAEGVGGSKPNFLYCMNRAGDNFNPQTKNQFLAMGARPKAFTKAITIKYKPNLCQALTIAQATSVLTDYYQIGTVPIYNWVQTWTSDTAGQQGTDAPPTFGDTGVAIAGIPAANNPNWQGHDVYISVDVAGGASNNIARAYCSVIWEFKDPFMDVPLPDTSGHMNL